MRLAADLEDDKYSRTEGHTMNRILQGWATKDISDERLLRRGIDLIDGLYHSLQSRTGGYRYEGLPLL